MEALQEIANQKIQEMIDSGAIQKSIEDGVSRAIDSAIATQFERYGTITKQIEKAIEGGLNIDINDLPFESYNAQMLVAVKQKLGNLFSGQAADKFLAEIDKTLAPAPKEIAINELVECIAAEWKTDEPWDASDLDEHATAELEPGTGCMSDTFTLKMWKQKDSSSSHLSRSSSPDLKLHISRGAIRINHSHGYNPTCFRDEEALIFKLYAAGTTITGMDSFDPDDCDLTLKEFDH